MALPDIGTDVDEWGDLLNAFLLVGHNADGTVKPFPVLSPSGDTTGVKDTAAISAAIAVFGGVQLGYAPAANPFWVTGPSAGAAIKLGDYQGLQGLGKGLTVVKLANSSNCNVIENADPVNGNTGCWVQYLTIDGNKTHQTAGANHRGLFFYLTAQDRVTHVEVQNCNNSGSGALEINGQANQAFSRGHILWAISAHGNNDVGVKVTTGAREVMAIDIRSYSNGGHGVHIDASEGTWNGISVRLNSGDGLSITNVFDCTIQGVRATLNRKHGIEVYGLLRSSGSDWVARNNSTSSSGTYDDVHFTDDGLNSYGRSSNSTITGVGVGPFVAEYGTATEGYGLSADSGVTGSVTVKDVAVATVGTAGGNGVLAPTVASSFRYFLAGESKSRNAVNTAAEGLVAQAFSRMMVDQSLAMTTQQVRYTLVGFKAGDVIAKVCFHVSSAPGTPANLTDLYVAVFKTDGTQLGVSADTATAGQSTGSKQVSLASAYVVPQDESLYLAVLCVGTSMPQLTAMLSEGVAPTAFSGGVTPAGVQTGQATMPSPATVSAGATCVWLAAA